MAVDKIEAGVVDSLPELILYKNRSGSSGVMAYALAQEAVFIKWTAQDDVYEYNYEVNGRDHVERMKWLAHAGRGLSGFISTQTGKYAARWTPDGQRMPQS